MRKCGLAEQHYLQQNETLMNRIKLIFNQMDKVYQPQRKFLMILLTSLMCLRGKANFSFAYFVS